MSKYNYYPGGVQVNSQLKEGVTGAQVGGYWAGGQFIQPNADSVWSDENGWMTKSAYNAYKNATQASAAVANPVVGGGSVSTGTTGSSNLRDVADPFHTQRAQYQNQLSSLMSNPDGFMNSSLFKSMTNNGLEAINRTAAAKRQLGSGNRLTDLMNYGQGEGSKQFFNYAGLLGNLAGANTSSPSAAASSMVSSQNSAQNYDIQNRQLAQGVRAYDDQQNNIRRAINEALTGWV